MLHDRDYTKILYKFLAAAPMNQSKTDDVHGTEFFSVHKFYPWLNQNKTGYFDISTLPIIYLQC